jgi:hypothetical protein
VFSNVFEVASKARPYEKVAVGKNIEYVIEAIRVEGTSGWRAPAQDEFALVMDGRSRSAWSSPTIRPGAAGQPGLDSLAGSHWQEDGRVRAGAVT